VIVVSHDGFNDVPTWRSVIVIPVSTSNAQAGRGPTAVLLASGDGGLRTPSVALCHQVTTLDRAKLSDRLGVLPRQALTEVEDGLRAALDLE
jgi:mRNA interferase MazF